METSRAVSYFKSTAGDPIPVEGLENPYDKHVPFFCICPYCGLTWRAKLLKPRVLLFKRKVKKFFNGMDVGVYPKQSYIGFNDIKCRCGAKNPSGWKRGTLRHDPMLSIGNGKWIYIPLESRSIFRWKSPSLAAQR